MISWTLRKTLPKSLPKTLPYRKKTTFDEVMKATYLCISTLIKQRIYEEEQSSSPMVRRMPCAINTRTWKLSRNSNGHNF